MPGREPALPDPSRASGFATELIRSRPDVIFCSTTPVTAALHRETSTIPIVFAIVSDPSGFIVSLSRPGGNITGFMNVEAAMGGKWLNLLKEIAPGIKRAAFMFNPDTTPVFGKHFLASFEAAAGPLAIEPVAMPVRSDAEIETAVATLGAEQAGLVEYSSFLAVHLGTIISSTARHNVPAIYENPQMPGEEAYWHTGRASRTCSAARPVTLIAFCAVRNQPTCRCRRQRNLR
jgi:putative tryptophan/tyrosine transport system substrate-binding protein